MINYKYAHAQDKGLRDLPHKPVDFVVAGRDAELIDTPCSYLWAQINGEGEIFVNGNKINPMETTREGLKIYRHECWGTELSAGSRKFPAINSVKISQGALFKFWIEVTPDSILL